MPQVTALSTLAYPDQRLGVALERVAARGFRTVEIADREAHCPHFPLGAADTEGLRGLLRTLGLQPIALDFGARAAVPAQSGTQVGAGQLDRTEDAVEYRAVMRQAILQCRALGIPVLLAALDRRSAAPDYQAEVETAAAQIGAVADEAYANGLRLTVKALHRASLLHDVARTAEFFALVASPHVGVTVDSGEWGALGYDLEELWKAVGPRIWHVHLSAATAPGAQHESGTPLHRGMGDIGHFGTWLDRHGYHGNVSVELGRAGRTVDEIDAAIDQMLARLAAAGWTLPRGVRLA